MGRYVGVDLHKRRKMKITRKFICVKAVVLFVFLFLGLVKGSYGANDETLYGAQLEKYPRISKDYFFKKSNSTILSNLNNQYFSNKKKYAELRESNQKMLRLYDEEKSMNERMRELLSVQIEEGFRLRLEFKKIQKEFKEDQESFMKNEMKSLGDKISEYERIKNNNAKLAEKVNDNYSEYMEFQKKFKKQQEKFYKKQVEFYEKIEGNLNSLMNKYERLNININDKIR